MAKRKLDKRELSFLLPVTDLKVDGTLYKGRFFHIIRETVTGHKIGACDYAQSVLENGDGYYTVPFFTFLYEALFPHICPLCEHAAIAEISPE